MKITKKTYTSILLLVFVAVVFITACDPGRKWEKEEKLAIQDYLSSIGDTVFELKPSGLYYLTVTEGSGEFPGDNDTVSIRFKGSFLDYRIFDSNLAQAEPLRFIVGSGLIIKGIDEGVRYMKVGGKAKMITPSPLAYGASGVWGLIAGYTPLRWEIQLVDLDPAK